jgi:hypothetical protein
MGFSALQPRRLRERARIVRAWRGRRGWIVAAAVLGCALLFLDRTGAAQGMGRGVRAGGLALLYLAGCLSVPVGFVNELRGKPALREGLSRLGLALPVMVLAFKAGSYAHLCNAGSPWIEGGAMLGTPLAAGALVLFVRARWIGLTAAGMLVSIVWLLQRPYLEWVHGPHSPWPGSLN